MTKHGFKERTRRMVLKERSQIRTGYGRIEDEPEIPPDPRKTLTMRLMEYQFRCPIEELLVEGSLEEVGQRLGVHISTVSKWRLRLGLRDGTSISR